MVINNRCGERAKQRVWSVCRAEECEWRSEEPAGTPTDKRPRKARLSLTAASDPCLSFQPASVLSERREFSVAKSSRGSGGVNGPSQRGLSRTKRASASSLRVPARRCGSGVAAVLAAARRWSHPEMPSLGEQCRGGRPNGWLGLAKGCRTLLQQHGISARDMANSSGESEARCTPLSRETLLSEAAGGFGGCFGKDTGGRRHRPCPFWRDAGHCALLQGTAGCSVSSWWCGRNNTTAAPLHTFTAADGRLASGRGSVSTRTSPLTHSV